MALIALSWGLIAGSALFLGGFIGWFTKPVPRVIAALMAFASGILLSVVAFEILDEAFGTGGFGPVAVGFVGGAVLFTAGLFHLDRAGARHRKRSHFAINPGRNTAAIVALATVIDTIPESLIIGLNFFDGEHLALATVFAVFLANVPESLSSTIRMRATGHGPVYVFGLWALVAAASALASLAGYLLLGELPDRGVAVVQAIAGGGLLVFIADNMIPEAFAETHEAAGLITALGLITGFGLSMLLG